MNEQLKDALNKATAPFWTQRKNAWQAQELARSRASDEKLARRTLTSQIRDALGKNWDDIRRLEHATGMRRIMRDIVDYANEHQMYRGRNVALQSVGGIEDVIRKAQLSITDFKTSYSQADSTDVLTNTLRMLRSGDIPHTSYVIKWTIRVINLRQVSKQLTIHDWSTAEEGFEVRVYPQKIIVWNTLDSVKRTEPGHCIDLSDETDVALLQTKLAYAYAGNPL